MSELYNKLIEMYEYSPDTGEFIFKERSGWIGRVAGSANTNGYILISINRKQYYAHRVAWLYMTGEWPQNQIDHINCNPGDNRWENLRQATKAENGRNRGINKNNTTGYKGIHRNKNKFMVRIVIGSYDTLEEAAAVYETAIKLFHGEFARTE